MEAEYFGGSACFIWREREEDEYPSPAGAGFNLILFKECDNC